MIIKSMKAKLVILLLAPIISMLFIFLSMKPLKEVEKSITDIASGNADLTRRIKVTSNDEIGNVVRGFNLFAEKLQSIISNVKKSNEKLGMVGDDMNDSMIEVKNVSSEMEEGNKMILSEVQMLQNATMTMTQGMDEMSVGARKINETGVALKGISSQMNDSITEISSQIDQFKV